MTLLLTHCLQIGKKQKGVSDININKNEVNFSMPNNLSVLMLTTDKKNTFIKKDFYRSVKPYSIQDSKQIILESSSQNINTLILISSNKYQSEITNPIIKDNILTFLKDGKQKEINLNNTN